MHAEAKVPVHQNLAVETGHALLYSPPPLPPAVVVLYTQSRASQEWREVSPGTLTQSTAAPGKHLPPLAGPMLIVHSPFSSDGPR